MLPPYGKYARSCPNSTELSATGVNLPTSGDVDEQIVERVARVFHDVLA
jgi:perosamine synthetase